MLRKYRCCCSFRTTGAGGLAHLLWQRCLSSQRKQNLYSVLGVSPAATQADIKQSFYKLSMRYHPDKNKDNVEATERFREITEAYSVLGQYEQRRRYDKGLLHGYAPPHVRQQATIKKKPIYDFDEFYRAHYGEALKREQQRREEMAAENKKPIVNEIHQQLAIAIGSTLVLVIGWGYMYDKKQTKHW